VTLGNRRRVDADGSSKRQHDRRYEGQPVRKSASAHVLVLRDSTRAKATYTESPEVKNCCMGQLPAGLDEGHDPSA
jgi:hypothetical protein